MKNSLRGLFSVMLMFAFALTYGQQYLITNSALNAGNPGNIRTDGDATTTGGTKVHAYNAGGGATINAWSGKIALPFAFNFYGIPVTKFVVSKNGLLSFDTTLATTTVAPVLNVNTALPNAALPNQTIAYFWEDFTTLTAGLGTNDDIWTYTHGTAPNRQFWVHNFSYAIGAQAFSYFAVVFDEAQAKFHVVDMSYTGTPANYTGTVGAQINATTAFQVSTGLNSVAGSPSIIMGSGGTAITDNEYYTFQYFPAGACFPPTGITFSSVTSAGLTLNWTGTGIGYEILYGPTGFNINTPPNAVSVIPTTQLITSLTSNATYDFYIIQKCSASISSVAAGPFTITTPVAPYIPPYIQDFTGSFPPAGYSQAKGKAKNPTVFSGTSNWNSLRFANAGTNLSARLNVYGVAYTDWLFTPTIDLGNGATNYQLEFDIALTPYIATGSTTLGIDDTLRVVISTDNGLTWNRVNTLRLWTSGTPISGTGEYVVIPLIGYTGLVKFGFYGESTISNADNDWFVDNIKVDAIPACPQPSALSATKITTNSATIKWLRAAATNTLEVEYGITGFTPGTGTVITVLTNDSLVLNGLSGSTLYEVYIKAFCTGSNSIQAGPLSFQTLCDTFGLPWTEGFEILSSMGSMPSCWDRASSTYWITNTGNQTYARRPKTGDNFLQARYGVNEYVYTPQFNLQAGVSYQFSFWYKSDGLSGWDSVVTAMGTSQTATAMTYKFSTKLVNLNDTTYKRYVTTFIPPASGKYYLGVKAVGNSVPWYLTFDNFELRKDPSPCPKPANVVSTTIGSSSIGLNWASPSGTNWIVQWGPTGFKQASQTGTITNLAALPHTFTGLTPNTYYDFYVTAGCGSNSSAQNGPFTFKTDCIAQLSGVYSVGGTAGPRNFTTLVAAIDQLNGCGVAGPVTINIAAGTYTGTYILKKVNGASAVNTITFNGASAATAVVNGSAIATIHLEGARHTTFKNLTVNNYGSASVGFLINKNADSNTVENCIINVDTIGTNNYSAGIMVSSSTTSATTEGAQVDRLVIRGNKITGGYRGVNVYGASAQRSKGLIIDNNTFRKNYYYGMYLYYVDNVVITKNKVTDMRNTFTYGISLNYSDNFDIQRNNLVAVNYGLYISNGNNVTIAPTTRSKIINNILIGEGTAGLYMTSIKYVDVYNNSMRGVRGAQMFTNSENNYQNNIFYGTTNLALDLGTAIGGTNALNYNLYYSGGVNIVKNGSTSYATLALFKIASPLLNINSLQGDPVFESNKNLHVNGTLANNAGNGSLGVLIDVDGDIRPAPGASAIDIGADEYTPLTSDAQMVKLISPADNSCGDSLTDVIVIVKNGGVSSFSNLNIGGVVGGATSGTLSTTSAKTLLSSGVDTINLGSINTVMGGTFNLTLYTNLSGDQKKSNDTLSLSISIRSSLAPVATASTDSSCQGQMVTLYLPNIPNQKFEWKNVNGTVIGTTDSLVVGPMGANDSTFYLSSVSQQSSLGPVGTSIGANLNFTDASVQQLYFNASQAFTLDSMTVFPNGNGNVNINLVDFATNAILQTVTVPVTGVTTPGMKVRIAVGMTIPAGNYKMHGGGSTTGGLFRNSAGAVYPYSVNGVVSITGNSFDPNYYYYFFDWKVSTGGCPRPDGYVTVFNGGKLSASFTNNSSSVQPTLTGYTVMFDGTASKGAATYSWDFGDGSPLGTSVSPQHTYTVNGTYTVTLTITGPCGTQSKTSTLIIQGISLEEQVTTEGMRIFPNPFSTTFTIDLGNTRYGEVSVKVLSANGGLLLQKTEVNSNGKIDIPELSTYPKGVYMLEINDNNQTVVKKIIKQ